MTPFEAVYGRPPPIFSRFVLDNTSNPTVSGSLRQRDETLAVLKSNLLQAQDRMKFQADKGRREVIFDIGDWVYVRLRPYRQLSVRLQRHSKLSRRFFWPFQIIQRIGDVAYKLDLPPSSRIHPVFHVSVLRKCIGKPTNQITPIELLDQTPSVTLTPEAVLKTRDVTKGAHKVPQCLVKWVGLPIEDATWEDSYTLLQQFPHLNLEDKVLLHEGGNVMTPQDKLDNNKRSTRYKRVPQYLDHYVVPDAKGK